MDKITPVYVRNAEMFKDIFTSLQHHGMADLIMVPEKEEEKVEYCLDCKCELTSEEEELGRCFLCHELAENDRPSPEDVYGREDIA